MGRTILVSLEQLPNAEFPIKVRVDGNESTPVQDEQDSNALFPIWVSTGGNTKEEMPFMNAKVPSLILLIADGIVTDPVNLPHP